MVGFLSLWKHPNHKISLGYLFVQLVNSMNFIGAICVYYCLGTSFEPNYFCAECPYQSPTSSSYVSKANYKYSFVTHKLDRLWLTKLLSLFL